MKSSMKILYGPPGTGKTWLAVREAVQAIEPAKFNELLGESDPDQAISKYHNEMVKNGRILWITFHPGYAYEDFMEGYRPITSEKEQLSYQIVDGPFKKLCDRARGDVDLQIGEELKREDGAYFGEVVDKDQGGWIIRVEINRSDKVAPEMFRYVDRFTIKRIIESGMPASIFSIPGVSILETVKYGVDPSSADLPEPDLNAGEDYATRKGSKLRKVIGARIGLSSTDLANSAHYGAVMRRLIELETAKPPATVALVIDEINRADLSRVFGELLTLLELDKREGEVEEKRVVLPYSKDHFSVPANLSVIGTMNTVDRSLSAMDFAMRRRFEFAYIDADPLLCPDEFGGVNLQPILASINKSVDVLLGKEYRIGHSFFMNKKLEPLCEHHGWTGTTEKLKAVAHIFRARIIPLLLEYFHDDWRKAEAIAGLANHAGMEYRLFDEIKAPRHLVEQLPEEYELEESMSFDMASWWDPSSADWNSERFKSFLTGLSSRE